MDTKSAREATDDLESVESGDDSAHGQLQQSYERFLPGNVLEIGRPQESVFKGS